MAFVAPGGRGEGAREHRRERTSMCVSEARTGQRTHRPSGATAWLPDEERREDERDGCQQLHQNVERGASRVLERVADGVADDGSRMGIGALGDGVALGVLEVARLDVLL